MPGFANVAVPPFANLSTSTNGLISSSFPSLLIFCNDSFVLFSKSLQQSSWLQLFLLIFPGRTRLLALASQTKWILFVSEITRLSITRCFGNKEESLLCPEKGRPESALLPRYEGTRQE